MKSVFQITQLETRPRIGYLQSLFNYVLLFSICSLLQKRDLVLLCKACGIQSSQLKPKPALSNIFRNSILVCKKKKNPKVFEPCLGPSSLDDSNEDVEEKPTTSASTSTPD